MIQPPRVSLLVLPALVIPLFASHPAEAHPTTSPSARAAVRLKYHPPKNYLRHYLADDRFKIGTIWKVLSTEADSDYHRPNCPLMLDQSANIAIGFASPADSLEAGYRPCGTCRPEIPVVIYAPATSNSTFSSSAQSVSPELRDASRIVNFLADQIRVTKSRSDLLLLRAIIQRLQNGSHDETVRSFLKGKRLRVESLSLMTGSLEWLKRAIGDKLLPNPAGIQLWPDYLQSARELVRPRTPQIQAQRQQNFNNRVTDFSRSFRWQGGRR